MKSLVRAVAKDEEEKIVVPKRPKRPAAKDEDEEIVIPKKPKAFKTPARASSSPRAHASMRRLMRATSGLGIFLGGFVTLVGVMSVVGLAVENFWVRLVVGLLVVVGLPSFVADRLLKRSDATLATRGGLGMVADAFAIVLLGIALALVGAEAVTSNLFRHEGDLYAKHGQTIMARAVYFVAGVSPAFPAAKAPGKPSASSSSSSGAAPWLPVPSGSAKGTEREL